MAEFGNPFVEEETEDEAGELEVEYVTDIPSIVRGSKYDAVLDDVKRLSEEGDEAPIRMFRFETQGQAVARVASLQKAVDKRPDADEYKVAIRTHDDDDVRVYVAYNGHDEPEEETEEEVEEEVA